MTENGERILDSIPETSSLSNPDNPMYKIIDYAVGGFLDAFEDKDLDSQFFLNTATGKYLDLHGEDYNIRRKLDESDEDYRQRIIYESLGRVTVDFLIKIYGVELYVYVPDFNVNNNTLVSDNPYISRDGYYAIVDENTKKILDKKFILDTDIKWLVLE